MYERHTDQLLPRRKFMRRVARHGGIAAVALGLSLILGTAGFHSMARQSWIDAFLNSSMLLAGMGPVGSFESSAGKLFASIYALYAGIMFLGASALLLAPIVHRALHRLHLEEKQRR
jgi:hypothetical protein